jgi:glycosyltransferase involved in cell wall biosynthesis
MPPRISVVVSTYNRAHSLPLAIESILAQKDAPPYELIVVDNCSTDGTAAVIREFCLRSHLVRYVFEPKQGLSHGRNAGIAHASAPVIAFTDDDVAVSEDWLRAIETVFERKPEFGCVGGKVLPRWPEPPPPWLTEKHWVCLALLDYGPPQALDADNGKCLIGANLGIRRNVFEQIGGFSPDFQKAGGLVYGWEDRELQERYWRAGGRCWFDPNIKVYAEVQPSRLKKQFHRRWRFKAGESQAAMKEPDFERSSWHLFGVPGHVLRRLAKHSAAALADTVSGRRDRAFEHQAEALFFAGFMKKRWGGPR